MSQGEVDAKIALVVEMLRSIEQLTRAEMSLRWHGQTVEAEQIKSKHDELRDEIDRLRGRVADAWSADLPSIEQAIEAANADVQAGVHDIQNSIDVAENVVKVIGQAEGALHAIRAIAHAGMRPPKAQS